MVGIPGVELMASGRFVSFRPEDNMTTDFKNYDHSHFSSTQVATGKVELQALVK